MTDPTKCMESGKDGKPCEFIKKTRNLVGDVVFMCPVKSRITETSIECPLHTEMNKRDIEEKLKPITREMEERARSIMEEASNEMEQKMEKCFSAKEIGYGPGLVAPEKILYIVRAVAIDLEQFIEGIVEELKE